ncbi:MAG TPA: hypothetical protein VF766_08695, partial [Pyrinomonadaceae bacterium]
GGAYGFAFDPRWFGRRGEAKRDCRNFWRDAGHEIEDLGEFIRESINEWTRRRAEKREQHGGTQSEGTNATP